MAQDNFQGAAQKAEEVSASIQGAVPEQPANLVVEPTYGTLQTSPANSGDAQISQGDEEAQDIQDEARDLEDLAAVSTGPVYSAFSTWQKRYIVVMVCFNFYLLNASLI
jgi:hypothetical protein